MSRIAKVVVFIAALALTTPPLAQARSRTVTGRVTAYSSSSISVLAQEVIVLRLTSQTIFTKLITQKPWEEDTRLDARALQLGQYVAVHVSREDASVAAWVQVATDMRLAPEWTSTTRDLEPSAMPSPQATSADALSGKEVTALIASAKSATDHLKLVKHFTAVAERYEADAAEHEEMAKAYRARPTPSETKRPGAPDTAAHCDRLAEYAKNSAREARALAEEHRAMATAAR